MKARKHVNVVEREVFYPIGWWETHRMFENDDVSQEKLFTSKRAKETKCKGEDKSYLPRSLSKSYGLHAWQSLIKKHIPLMDTDTTILGGVFRHACPVTFNQLHSQPLALLRRTTHDDNRAATTVDIEEKMNDGRSEEQDCLLRSVQVTLTSPLTGKQYEANHTINATVSLQASTQTIADRLRDSMKKIEFCITRMCDSNNQDQRYQNDHSIADYDRGKQEIDEERKFGALPHGLCLRRNEIRCWDLSATNLGDSLPLGSFEPGQHTLISWLRLRQTNIKGNANKRSTYRY